MIYDLEKENKEILARYKDLISNTYRTLDEEQNKLIRKAFDIRADAIQKGIRDIGPDVRPDQGRRFRTVCQGQSVFAGRDDAGSCHLDSGTDEVYRHGSRTGLERIHNYLINISLV